MNNKNYSCFSKAFLLVALLCCVSTEAFAYNFSATNDDGVTIYYNRIVNNGVVEAEVTCMDVDDYSGVVNIPATVTDEENEKELSVTSIGGGAFGSCKGLTSVAIPNSVTSIDYSAFYSCEGLESITIPNYVTSIGDAAFSTCSSMTSVTIGSSVGSIGSSAFAGCSKLESITIPSSVTSIGNGVFNGCSSLTSIEVEDENKNYHTDSNCLIETTSNKLIGACNLANITIPSSVESIGNSAFSGYSKLTSVTIPSSVTNIGTSAFYGCSKLTSVTIPSLVTNIDFAAFYNCSSLAEVILLGDALPECGNYAFYGISSTATLYCKSSLVGSCTEAPWKGFKSVEPLPYIEIPEVGYATGCFDFDLDFTSLGDNVAAYIASAFSPTESTVLLTRAKKIPAKTGFIVHGKAGTYDIPVASTDYVYSNMLVGVLTETTVSQTEGDYTNYTLRKNSANEVAFLIADGSSISANRAYLRIPTSKVSTSSSSGSTAKTSLSLSFDDEDENDDTTGISEIKEQHDRTSGTTVIYNLNGQRKQSLTKGLNIVNGKKIFIK